MPRIALHDTAGRAALALIGLTLAILVASPIPAAERSAIETGAEPLRQDPVVTGLQAPLFVRAAPAACDAPTSEERVKCKLQNALDQAEDTTAMVMMMEDVPENHKHALMQETIRARRAEGRTGKDDFKHMMKKKHAGCQVVEQDEPGTAGATDGDNDGICTGSEICAEAQGDGIGNDDAQCDPRNGKNREICAEICDEEGIAIEENLDAAAGQELEDDLDRATDHFMELNHRLEEDMVVQARVRQLMENDDPCAAVMVGGLSRPPNVEDRKPNALLGAALVVRDVQKLQADIADKACSVDGVGFNVKVVCAVFEGIRAIAIVVATVQEIKRDKVTSATLDMSFECIKKLDREVGESTAALDAIKERVATLEQQVAEADHELMEVMRLVTTPPGRRPEYPRP